MSKFSKKEIERAYSPRRTDEIIKAIETILTDPEEREEVVAMIRAIDLKRIRNTSGT